ncbi:MAG: alpha/beta fold hydrolase [Sphingomonadaceae bacterium]
MLKRFSVATLALALSACAGPMLADDAVADRAAAAPAEVALADVPLIEREKLFGNPSQVAGRISPDGQWLSWLAPRDGVLNIWLAPVSDPGDARPMTNERERPIRSYFWAPDSRQLLFINDKGGDENYLLYGVDVETGEQKTLTPFENTRATVVEISNRHRDRILVGLNNRDPRWHDVHSLDLDSGELTLVMQNDGYAGFVADNDLDIRLALRPRPDGGQDIFRVVDGEVEAEPFTAIGLEDSLTTSPAGFSANGDTLYWIDSRGRNTAALIAQNVATGEKRVIAENDRTDIAGVLVDPSTFEVEAYAVNYLKPEWKPIDPEIAAALEFLERELDGHPIISSRSLDDSKWIVAVDPVTEPSASYLFDREAGELTRLYVSRPELIGAPLVPQHPVEIVSRDGLTLPSFLTLPRHADPDGDGDPDRAVPMALVVHGGPWSRDTYGYSSYHQWLANRGYAVLSVNFRGSTGFGKDFVNAGNLEWGRKMHDDLIDAVRWAVAEGVTSEDEVAIIGGSYGGYATLAGLTFTPEQFACGVDIVGPSNLFTLLETIPPYWEAIKLQFYQRMGDPTTEEGRALLEERSPLNYADRIVRPLLIGQGANDPRVNIRESDQIVEAMKNRDIPVTYIVFPDEGHGFAKPENGIAFNAVAENFLAECLGGRAEPIGDALARSSAEVRYGAEYTRGLPAAIGGE